MLLHHENWNLGIFKFKDCLENKCFWIHTAILIHSVTSILLFKKYIYIYLIPLQHEFKIYILKGNATQIGLLEWLQMSSCKRQSLVIERYTTRHSVTLTWNPYGEVQEEG